CYLFFFFFQAEDGIRDFHVTGVQTCALPILELKGVCKSCVTVAISIVLLLNRRVFSRFSSSSLSLYFCCRVKSLRIIHPKNSNNIVATTPAQDKNRVVRSMSF